MIVIDQLRKDGWCHMMALDIPELDRFARRIGVRTNRFHRSKNGKIHHYDLKEIERKKAVEHGAIEVSSKILVEYFRTKDTRVVIDSMPKFVTLEEARASEKLQFEKEEEFWKYGHFTEMTDEWLKLCIKNCPDPKAVSIAQGLIDYRKKPKSDENN